MSFREIFNVRFNDQWVLDISVGPIGWIVLILLLAAAILFSYRRLSGKTWRAVEVEISLGKVGKLKIRPTHETIRIAHQAWAELVTRKAALPFDEQHDVIVEVYDSWYELFQEFRGLAKAIPAEHIRQFHDARTLVHVLVKALNDGLRPHLTVWQAEFRAWYEKEVQKESTGTPQQVQQSYPHYTELVNDLKRVNTELREFSNALQQIAHGKRQEGT